MENLAGRNPATFKRHRDGKRFHVRCLNGEMQVFGVALEHVAMCPDLPRANMVAAALELAAEAVATTPGKSG